MVADLRAAQYYQPSYLERPNVQTAINHAHCFYIEGFFLTVSLDSILTLAKHAATNNKIFAMNISAPFLCQFFCEAMDATTPYWDFIFGNETEAIAWATCHGYETKKLQEIALLLANQPKLNNRRKRYVIITQGSQATLVAKQGQISVEQVQSFTVKSIPQEEIKDTEGAGDAFVGGFLSQYLQGKSIAYSVQVGHLLAGCIIRQMGAQYPSTLNLSELHV
jgi:adenosine kinase